MNVTNNLHRLEAYLEDAKVELQELRKTGFEPTQKYLESYAPPTEREKNEMFEDFVQEMKSDLQLLNKKIGVVDTKCTELGDITDHFHDSTDKLEALYARDISKRKQVFHGSITTEDNI